MLSHGLTGACQGPAERLRDSCGVAARAGRNARFLRTPSPRPAGSGPSRSSFVCAQAGAFMVVSGSLFYKTCE
eukprot:scaffold1127_cov93-Isochrysis_galbana.AAC.3